MSVFCVCDGQACAGLAPGQLLANIYQIWDGGRVHTDLGPNTGKSIDRCRDAGILNGKTENRFCPTDLLTREEAAAALDRMMCWVEKSIDERIKGEF